MLYFRHAAHSDLASGPGAPVSAPGFSMSGRIGAALPGNGANAGSPHQSPPANLHRFQLTDVDQFVNLGAPNSEDAGSLIPIRNWRVAIGGRQRFGLPGFRRT